MLIRKESVKKLRELGRLFKLWIKAIAKWLDRAVK